jgi:ADP-ribose pyrophosphatase
VDTITKIDFLITGSIAASLARESLSSPIHVIEAKDWVNAVAADLEILLVRDYQHGSGEITTGLPSGTSDPGDDELSCAQRVLRVETGAEASAWYPIGRVFANPTIRTNKVHFFLALGAALGGKTHFDGSEEIETCLMPAAEVYRGLFDGALVV